MGTFFCFNVISITLIVNIVTDYNILYQSNSAYLKQLDNIIKSINIATLCTVVILPNELIIELYYGTKWWTLVLKLSGVMKVVMNYT
jgi:hypothetical protein